MERSKCQVLVEGTSIVLTGDNFPKLKLTAELMASQQDNEGLPGPIAHKMVENLMKKKIDLDLVGVFARKEKIRPAQAAELLLKDPNNILRAIAWRTEESGTNLYPDHTV